MTETITTPEALDALPVGSVVLIPGETRHRVAEVRDAGTSGGRYLRTFNGADHYSPQRFLPLTVLHRPDAPAPSAEDVEALALLDDAIVRVPKIGGAGAIYEAELLSVLRAAQHALAARQPETTTAESSPWQHDGHRPVQHRDGKPPWCDACGFDSPTPARPAVRRGEPRG